MNLHTASVIYFSPTGTTRRTLDEICAGLQVEAVQTCDLTRPDGRLTTGVVLSGDIVIIGIPVYEERVPELVLPFLQALQGCGQPTVLVALYGNIGEGIALQELQDIARHVGLRVVAGASFVGEHSFANAQVAIASGRPDAADLQKARHFGQMVRGKLFNGEFEQMREIVFPSHLPLMARILPRNSARFFARQPEVDLRKCTRCGLCVQACPLGLIDAQTLVIRSGACLRCFACVRRCTRAAREIVFRKKWLVTRVLRRQSRKRREMRGYFGG